MPNNEMMIVKKKSHLLTDFIFFKPSLNENFRDLGLKIKYQMNNM
jgi:hypothetical protein